VATDMPESIAKRIADVGTCTSLRTLGMPKLHCSGSRTFCVRIMFRDCSQAL
jgi:hypothetical protein